MSKHILFVLALLAISKQAAACFTIAYGSYDTVQYYSLSIYILFYQMMSAIMHVHVVKLCS